MKLPTYLIESELKRFETEFQGAVRSQAPLLDRIMRYVVKRKGKQLRPMFVLLSAKLCGEINEKTYQAASLVEILHTATLVHDDVVDDSLERRGFFSTYALWKAKANVLIGDYLLAKGLLLSLDHQDYRILHILSDAVRLMSEGELLQIEKARKLDITEDVYLEIIRQKTATLIAACCAMGAQSVNASEQEVARLTDFGQAIGMAFQIKDDLFDYGSARIGKPLGIDIKERKLTLPLIHALNQGSPTEVRWLMDALKNHNTDRKRVQEVIQKVRDLGGIAYAEQKMKFYQSQAITALDHYPDSPYKASLLLMIDYVIDRQK